MQSSVRAVETYRRSRLIDAVTSDENKIAPVYKLEEICQVLRSSTLDVVREMLDHTMKRLEHKNPIVKQKVGMFANFALFVLPCFLSFTDCLYPMSLAPFHDLK
jgi:hypothetical protein